MRNVKLGTDGFLFLYNYISNNFEFNLGESGNAEMYLIEKILPVVFSGIEELSKEVELL